MTQFNDTMWRHLMSTFSVDYIPEDVTLEQSLEFVDTILLPTTNWVQK